MRAVINFGVFVICGRYFWTTRGKMKSSYFADQFTDWVRSWRSRIPRYSTVDDDLIYLLFPDTREVCARDLNSDDNLRAG